MDGLVREVQVQLAQLGQARSSWSRTATRLEGELARLRRLLRAGDLDAAAYRDLTAETEAELRTARARLVENQEQEARLRAEQGSQRHLRALLSAMDSFDALPREQQKHLLGQLIARLRVYKPKGHDEIRLEIEWRVPSRRSPDYAERRIDIEP